jgi:hypothetical protein
MFVRARPKRFDLAYGAHFEPRRRARRHAPFLLQICWYKSLIRIGLRSKSGSAGSARAARLEYPQIAKERRVGTKDHAKNTGANHLFEDAPGSVTLTASARRAPRRADGKRLDLHVPCLS